MATIIFDGERARPEDVRQLFWRRDCHLLATAQAVAARHEGWLMARFVPTAHGVEVRCHRDATGMAPQVQTVCVKYPGRLLGRPRWPRCMEAAFAVTNGGRMALLRRNEAEVSMRWLLGTLAETRSLLGASGAAAELGILCRLFGAGAVIVVHTRRHSHAVVGQASDGRLRLMNPSARSRHSLLEQHQLGSHWVAMTYTFLRCGLSHEQTAGLMVSEPDCRKGRNCFEGVNREATQLGLEARAAPTA